MAVNNVKSGPLTWGSLGSRLYREPMDSSVLNYSYADLLWELNQVDNTYTIGAGGHSGGGMSNYYVGMITSVPYVNGKHPEWKTSHGTNEPSYLRGPWYITYCATDQNEGTGKYGFQGHIDDEAIALNTYYADRIVLKQEMDYAMQSGSTSPWQLGTYYTGVGLWYDAYIQAKKYLESGEDLPDNTYIHTTSYSEIFNDYANNIAVGNFSHAEGTYTYTYGGHAEGAYTSAGIKDYSVEGLTAAHAEGYLTKAYAPHSHAEGYGTYTYGLESHAEGIFTYALGDGTHTEGMFTYANGEYASHAEGSYTYAAYIASHAEGIFNFAYSTGTHAEGTYTTTYAAYSHTEGIQTHTMGFGSHAEGYKSKTNGTYSHAEGMNTEATGDYSHSEGMETHASGAISHSEGWSTVAFETGAHSEGINTKAQGLGAHAEGIGFIEYKEIDGVVTYVFYDTNIAYGQASHVEGYGNTAYGDFTHVQGSYSTAYGNSSFSSGIGIQSYSDGSANFGYWNVSKSNRFTVGDGTDDDNRHNVFAISDNSQINIDSKGFTLVDSSYINLDAPTINVGGPNTTNTYIHSNEGTYITYGTGENVNNALFVNQEGATYFSGPTYIQDFSSENHEYSPVISYAEFSRAYDIITEKMDGALGALPGSVASLDSLTVDETTNILNYSYQTPVTSSEWKKENQTITFNSATSSPKQAGLMSGEDKWRLDSIWEGDKPLSEVSITNSSWEIFDNSGKTYTGTMPSGLSVNSNGKSNEQNLTIEYGFKVRYTGCWKWSTFSKTKKGPTTASGEWGTDIPNEDVNSSTYTSGIFEVTGNAKIASEKITAPRQGLMVSGNKVIPATGFDEKSNSVSYYVKRLIFYGAVDSSTPDMNNDMCKLSCVATTSKSYTIESAEANADQFYAIAIPTVAFGNLSSIIQDGALPVLSAFNTIDSIYTNGAGVTITYKIYVSGNKGAFTGNKLTLS